MFKDIAISLMMIIINTKIRLNLLVQLVNLLFQTFFRIFLLEFKKKIKIGALEQKIYNPLINFFSAQVYVKFCLLNKKLL